MSRTVGADSGRKAIRLARKWSDESSSPTMIDLSFDVNSLCGNRLMDSRGMSALHLVERFSRNQDSPLAVPP